MPSVTIKIPYTVDQATRRKIRDMYHRAIEEMADEEREYVERRLPRVIHQLRTKGGWHRDIAETAESLALLLEEAVAKPRRVPHKARRVILAALFYLCDPFDVIPDYTPGKGYLDDAIVLNLCMSKLKRVAPSIHRDVIATLTDLQ